MTQKQQLLASSSTVIEELTKVAAALESTEHADGDRLTLLRRQAALGDLRDEIARRVRLSDG